MSQDNIPLGQRPRQDLNEGEKETRTVCYNIWLKMEGWECSLNRLYRSHPAANGETLRADGDKFEHVLTDTFCKDCMDGDRLKWRTEA